MKKIEFLLFKFFLKRFCNTQLDQWERWKISTKYGPVFVELTRQTDGYNYQDLK